MKILINRGTLNVHCTKEILMPLIINSKNAPQILCATVTYLDCCRPLTYLQVLLIFFNLKKYYTLLILILKRLGYVQVKAHAKTNLWRNHKIRGRGQPEYMWNGHQGILKHRL